MAKIEYLFLPLFSVSVYGFLSLSKLFLLLYIYWYLVLQSHPWVWTIQSCELPRLLQTSNQLLEVQPCSILELEEAKHKGLVNIQHHLRFSGCIIFNSKRRTFNIKWAEYHKDDPCSDDSGVWYNICIPALLPVQQEE